MHQVVHSACNGSREDSHLRLKVQKLENAKQEEKHVGAADGHVQGLQLSDEVELAEGARQMLDLGEIEGQPAPEQLKENRAGFRREIRMPNKPGCNLASARCSIGLVGHWSTESQVKISRCV